MRHKRPQAILDAPKDQRVSGVHRVHEAFLSESSIGAQDVLPSFELHVQNAWEGLDFQNLLVRFVYLTAALAKIIPLTTVTW